jgi:hypothetical protein
MTIKDLEKLPTKRLLAFYKAERERQAKLPLSLNYWSIDLYAVKKLLDEREHIEKKK